MKTMKEIEDKIVQIVKEHLDVPPGKITVNSDYVEDLGADSLDGVELIMAFEEEFDVEIPDEVAESLASNGTIGETLKFLASKFDIDDSDIDFDNTVVKFFVNDDGKLSASLQKTDGTWVFADGVNKLPSGLYVTLFNKWSTVLRQLEEMINDPTLNESVFQDFLESHPELIKGAKFDAAVSQAIISPDHKNVKWKADFVLSPVNEQEFCEILELKKPNAPIFRSERSGHNLFVKQLYEAVNQLKDYAEAFNSKQTREIFKNTYNIDVFRPDIHLIMGRRNAMANPAATLNELHRLNVKLEDWDSVVERMRREFT